MTIKFDSPYIYEAKLIRVVDGDTVHLEVSKDFELNIEFGFKQQENLLVHRSAQETFRLARINAPEMNTDAGKKAKEELQKILGLGFLTAKTYKPDKYGRWLVDLDVRLLSNPSSVLNANDEMVKRGFAVPYMEK